MIETASKVFYPGDIPGSAADFNVVLVSMIPDISVTLSGFVLFCFFSHRLAGLTGSHSEGTSQIYFAFIEPLYCTS